MSRQSGKREAEREKWHKGGDPFAADGAQQKRRRLTGWKRGGGHRSQLRGGPGFGGKRMVDDLRQGTGCQ